MAKLAGPSFSHGYIIGQYENLKNDLNGLIGTGRHGIVDRAIRRAEQWLQRFSYVWVGFLMEKSREMDFYETT